jgi:hypothetical protein
VKLAGRYGVSRTARALGVGYYSLKDRVEKETSSSAAGGGKMRVHLKGVEVPDLVALSRSFWEGRR